MTREIFKSNFDVENFYGLGVKLAKKQGKLGAKFAWKFMCPEFNQIYGKVEGDEKSLKINLDVENVGGLGVKTTMKQGKLGAKFAPTFMCQEFYQIKG